MAKTKKPKKSRPDSRPPADADVTSLTAATGNLSIKTTPDFSNALIKKKPTRIAAPAVLGTYELLEKILLSMPKPRSKTTLKTILLLQRVSKMFQHVIGRSEAIQDMLFFKPCAEFGVKTAYVPWNPLLLVTEAEKKSLRAPKAYTNGYLCCNNSVVLRGCRKQGNSKGPVDEAQTESWRRMLLAQTRVEYAYIETDIHDKCESLQRTLTAEYTMGLVFELLQQKSEGVVVKDDEPWDEEYEEDDA